jgi:hypothetical protein
LALRSAASPARTTGPASASSAPTHSFSWSPSRCS